MQYRFSSTIRAMPRTCPSIRARRLAMSAFCMSYVATCQSPDLSNAGAIVFSSPT